MSLRRTPPKTSASATQRARSALQPPVGPATATMNSPVFSQTSGESDAVAAHSTDQFRDSPSQLTRTALSLNDLACDDIVTKRVKRKFDLEGGSQEFSQSTTSFIEDLFSSFSTKIEKRFAALHVSINQIADQNCDTQKSLSFMSEKYDHLFEKLKTMEEERLNDKKTIQTLEDKIELLEKRSRATAVEIRNTPRIYQQNNRPESKTDLCDIVKILAKAVNCSLQESDIRDVYRIPSKHETSRPIILDLNSVIKKEALLNAIKEFNRNKGKGEKLNTSHLNLPGTSKPIYVSEALTHKTQKLFFVAREFAKEYNFTYCWTSRGVIYLRKDEKQPYVRVDHEKELQSLKNSISK
ncbi:unnamed protein product [Parnassius apollo]|uniref:(apollo) hypothetical protein n=1 Tax=Parnassius apollo TaxID=110799 RepID=A0A8S3W042_PARAO|nr:unnamed protein product [Parnassius apollo]